MQTCQSFPVVAKFVHLPCVVTHAKDRFGWWHYHLCRFCLSPVLRKKATEVISTGGWVASGEGKERTNETLGIACE